MCVGMGVSVCRRVSVHEYECAYSRSVCDFVCVHVCVSLLYNIVCQPAALHCTALHSRVEMILKCL